MVRDYVTFHFYFPFKHQPEVATLNSKYAANYEIDCNVIPPASSNTYRKLHSMTYPINVGRNIARESSNSHYILPADIELYPNVGLIPAFLQMITRGDEAALKRNNPRIFVISIFEIREGHVLPYNKKELLDYLKTKVVLPFHKLICSQCHSIPKAKEWLSDPLSGMQAGTNKKILWPFNLALGVIKCYIFSS